MKLLNIIALMVTTMLIISCATTPDFNKRRYTKGKFRIPHTLKKYKGEKEKVIIPIKDIEKVPAFSTDSIYEYQYSRGEGDRRGYRE